MATTKKSRSTGQAAKKTRSTSSSQAKKTTSSRSSSAKKETPVMPVSQSTTKKVSFLDQARNPKVFIPVLVVLAALFLYFAKGWFLVAIVNGHPISRVTLDRELEAKYGKTVLNSLLTKELIQEEAAKKHVTVSNAELQAAMKQISDAVSQQGQSLDQVLAARNMTKSDFEDQVRLQKLVEKLLADQIKVSDQEVQDYINNNKDSLPQGLSDDQLKVQVAQQLQQQKLSDKAQAWIQQLQQKAKIQYFINL